MERTCDGCAECCKGHLNGSAHGHQFYRGRKCFFLKDTCTIYSSRPEDPCKNYKCEWLSSDTLPMWMRPDLCDVIVTKRNLNTPEGSLEYYELVECDKKMQSEVLNWFFQWAVNNNKNLLYHIDQGKNSYGSQLFLKYI